MSPRRLIHDAEHYVQRRRSAHIGRPDDGCKLAARAEARHEDERRSWGDAGL